MGQLVFNVKGKVRIIRNITFYEPLKGLTATYRGFRIVIEIDDEDEDEDDPRFSAFVRKSDDSAFATIVDGIFDGPIGKVAEMCIENILF